MKLLILTQKIDRNDDLLGFMHRWVIEFAKRWEKITVIALGVGEYDLPSNVQVFSLGKEAGESKLKYLIKFYTYLWQTRKNYDVVFVHMNQEYVILGGWLWRLLGKKVALWRNHQADGLRARLAVFFSQVVFCTSKFAFVSRYKKSQIMPVGIDTDFFNANPVKPKIPRSILFFGRISPVKRVELLIESLSLLKKEKIDFSARIVGDAPARDRAYLEKNQQRVKDEGLTGLVEFKPGLPYWQAPEIYRESEIFVNLTNSGSLDKTTLEAMACEQLVLVSNRALEDIFTPEQKELMMFKEMDARDLTEKVKGLFNLDAQTRDRLAAQARKMVIAQHSLKALADKLLVALKNNSYARK